MSITFIQNSIIQQYNKKTQKMFIKVYLKNENHMLSLKSISNIQMLHTLIKTLFKNLPQNYILNAQLNDGYIQICNDQDIQMIRKSTKYIINVTIQDKNQICLDQTHLQDEILNSDNQHKSDKKQVEKEILVYATSNPQIKQQNQQQSYHKQILKEIQQSQIPIQQIVQQYCILFQCMICDNINKSNVLYRCSVCPDLDICENCQAYYKHSHPFVKIKNKKDMKIKIFAVMQEELPNKKLEQPMEDKQKQAKLIQKKVSKQQKHNNDSILQKTMSGFKKFGGWFSSIAKKQQKPVQSQINYNSQYDGNQSSSKIIIKSQISKIHIKD